MKSAFEFLAAQIPPTFAPFSVMKSAANVILVCTRDSAPLCCKAERQRQRRKTTLIGSPVQQAKTAQQESHLQGPQTRKHEQSSRVLVDLKHLHCCVLSKPRLGYLTGSALLQTPPEANWQTLFSQIFWWCHPHLQLSPHPAPTTSSKHWYSVISVSNLHRHL